MKPRHFKPKQKRGRKQSAASASITGPQGWRDRLNLIGWFALPVVFLLLLIFFGARAQWRKSIDDRLAAWKREYHLDDATVERFRQIELEFHGSGNPLTTPVEHKAEEVKLHHEQMASLMEPESRKKFLYDLHTGRRKH